MNERVRRFGTVDSTMTKAAELAAAGAASGTVVVADEQTAGQGRLGRSWHSEPGSGLYLTMIVRPKVAAESLPVATLALGLAAAEAIGDVGRVGCDLRWPNDVLIRGRKVAGILAQLHDGVLLAGIGVNVNHVEFPEDIGGIATSLRIESGREHALDVLLITLIGRVDEWLETLFREGRDPVLRAFTQVSSYVRGRRVVVEQGDGEIRGTTDGLDQHGFLYVREDSGRRTLILAGGVRPEA